jgi:hypothetical protein
MDKLLTYPTPLATRSGCKVSWASYASEALANQAAEAAMVNARILERDGYDFGMQSPGHIEPRTTDNGPLWEVTLP